MSDKWTKRFLELAFHVAEWSKDPSTKVGCVLVNKNRVVIGMGYNGFPRGVCDHKSRYSDREVKYRMVQHAEVNALFNAVSDVKGCTAYVTHPPCCNCAGALIQSGVKTVVTLEPDEGLALRFKESFETAEVMFNEAGVNLALKKLL